MSQSCQTFQRRTLAHTDDCHRWHSRPSDNGSYISGDLGYDDEGGGSVEEDEDTDCEEDTGSSIDDNDNNASSSDGDGSDSGSEGNTSDRE